MAMTIDRADPWTENGRARLSDAEEMVQLVDAEDRPTGIAGKLDAHHAGLRHRAFSVILRDGGGRMLLQQRAFGKYHSPGLWTNTCCGHPRPGEATMPAARRRLAEELGISVALRPLGQVSYAVQFDNGLSENEVVTLYAGNFEGVCRPNPEEVAAVRWLDDGALRSAIAAEPESFTYWFRLYLHDHAAMLEPERWVPLAAAG